MSKSVLITGANRGLGYELTKMFHNSEYIVFPLIRTEEASEALLNEFGNNLYPIVADLRFDDCIVKIRNVMLEKVNSLDVLINNAGIPSSIPDFFISKVSTEFTGELFNVHCLGPVRTIQAVIELMKSSEKPLIVNITSRLGSLEKNSRGDYGSDFSYSYRIAKAAQNMLTVCLNQEVKKEGICTIAVHPGRFQSNLGPSTGEIDACTAAKNIYNLVEKFKPEDSGKFIHPGEGILPW
jgi:NAD(P)-dependent dehydrogenase (short-subunit alcohol dehydrogenase family)